MNKNKMWKVIIASVCAWGLSVPVASADSLGNDSGLACRTTHGCAESSRVAGSIVLTEAQAMELANKISEAGSLFGQSRLNPGGFFIKVSDADLLEKWRFTASEVKLLRGFEAGVAPAIHITERSSSPISTRSTRLFHISNIDLKAGSFAFLATAAEAGPAAVAAVWPLLTSLAGPLGTAAGIATSVLGAYFFADLAAKVVGAIYQGKGITFYSDWAVPPISVKIEGK